MTILDVLDPDDDALFLLMEEMAHASKPMTNEVAWKVRAALNRLGRATKALRNAREILSVCAQHGDDLYRGLKESVIEEIDEALPATEEEEAEEECDGRFRVYDSHGIQLAHADTREEAERLKKETEPYSIGGSIVDIETVPPFDAPPPDESGGEVNETGGG